MADSGPSGRPKCGTQGGKDADYNLPLHIAAVFLVLFCSILGAGFPVVAKRIPALRVPAWMFFFCKHFGTGVLLATAFVHLLPTAFTSLSDPCLPPVFSSFPPFPGALALASLFSLFSIELYLNKKLGAHGCHSHGGPKGAGAGIVTSAEPDGGPASPYHHSGPAPDPEKGNGVGEVSYEYVSPSVARDRTGVVRRDSTNPTSARSGSGSGDSMLGFQSPGRRAGGRGGAAPGVAPAEGKNGARKKSGLRLEIPRSGTPYPSASASAATMTLSSSSSTTFQSQTKYPEGGLEPPARAVTATSAPPNIFDSTHRRPSHPHPAPPLHAPARSGSPADEADDDEEKGMTKEQRLAIEYKRKSLEILLLEGGILFHSVFVGITISLTTGAAFISLLVAILFHQTFEGLGLGSRIAAIPDKVRTRRRWMGWAKPWMMVAAFGMTAPVGQVIGLVAREKYDSQSGLALGLVGVCNAISSGLLIYAAVVDLLYADLLSPEADAELRWREKVTAFGYILLGAAGMSVVGGFA